MGKMIPDATDHQRATADGWLLEEEPRLLEEGNGQLYPEVKKTLQHYGIKGCACI
ncbi:hypothetical protein [Effusibacillus consociatus]|uniref:Uncharacterized protein n=1 Tax=Effusibacillus consociatus TaxID=1117041 RepID=A0ABV9PWW2_9BACL